MMKQISEKAKDMAKLEAWGKRCRMTNRVPDPDAGVGCVLLMGLVLIALAIVLLFALLIRAFI